jgi:hypothetical protein
LDKLRKKVAEVIPKGVSWIKDFATGLTYPKNSISTNVSGYIFNDLLKKAAIKINYFRSFLINNEL